MKVTVESRVEVRDLAIVTYFLIRSGVIGINKSKIVSTAVSLTADKVVKKYPEAARMFEDEATALDFLARLGAEGHTPKKLSEALDMAESSSSDIDETAAKILAALGGEDENG